MIIICEKCHTRFLVMPNSIGPQGRTVKCASCGHVWLQKPVEDPKEDKPKAVEKKEDRALPVKKATLVGGESPRVLKRSVAVVALLVATIGFFFYPAQLAFLQPVYDLAGMRSSKDFVLRGVKIEKEGKDIYIMGKILNRGEDVSELPGMRVMVQNGNRETIASFRAPISSVALKPEQAHSFRNRISNVPKQAAYVVLDIGNPVELALR